MNNITKTIKESLKEFEKECCEVYSTVINGEVRDILYLKNFRKREMNLLPTAQALKNNLLQSQITLLEAVIQKMREDLLRSDKIYTIEDQISSLEEVKKELTENL